MKSLKYIIKRIIIGTGIALAVMFIKQTAFAYEWETSSDTNIDLTNYTIISSIETSNGVNLVNSSLRCPPSYPINTTQANIAQSFSSGTSSGSFNSSSGIYSIRSQVSTQFQNRWYVSFGSYEFSPDTYYKVIIPLGYNNTVYTSLSDNVNEPKLLDSSIYSFSEESFSVYSASFAFGVQNDLENNSTFPNYLYFNIIFSTNETNHQPLTLYINGDSTITHSLTNFNVISDNNYLFKTDYSRTACATSYGGGYYSNRFYKPFLYTTQTGSDGCTGDGCYLDGNESLQQTADDIKTQIDNIINGQFTEDLQFPNLNGGGRPFGTNDKSLQELLLMPIEWLRTLVLDDTVCTGVNIPVPGFSSSTMTLPCLTPFVTNIFGNDFVIYLKAILGVVLGFNIIYALYRSVIHILSPDHFLWIDDIF